MSVHSLHVDRIKADVTPISDDAGAMTLLVHSFELELALNAIPSVTLDILPISSEDRGSGNVTASTPSFSDITKLYSRLLPLAEALETTATITLEILSENEDEQSPPQKVVLKDWVMSAVGISSITSYSAPMLQVVFNHPAKLLDASGTIYEKISSLKSSYAARISEIVSLMDSSSLLGLMDSVYAAFANGQIGTGENSKNIQFYGIKIVEGMSGKDNVKRSEDIVRGIRKSLKDYLPSDYIEDGTKCFFLQEDFKRDSGLMTDLKRIIAESIAPSAFGHTTWASFVQILCPHLLLSVVPTYDSDKLRLEAMSPWQQCQLVVDTRNVQAIDVASVDPDPVYGTATRRDMWVPPLCYNNACQTETPDVKDDFSHAFYFPEKVSSGRVGKVKLVYESPVITQMVDIGRTRRSDAFNADSEDKITSFNATTSSTYQSAMSRYTKAMFTLDYRCGCQASLTTIPMFYDISASPVTIHPGRVLTVFDAETESKPFFGFVTRVTTRASIDGGGSTHIVMSYARPTEEGSTLVPEGTLNPAYEFTGV